MNNLKKTLVYTVSCASLVLSACIISCKPDAITEITVDKEFKSMFYSDSGGITGADGIFSVPLPNGSSVFFLGDCFLGTVEKSARDFNTTMLRNAFNIINKEQTGATAIYRGEYNDPKTLMEPENVSGDSTYRWYWPGHGFVKNDTLYVFALNLYNEPSAKVKSKKSKEDQNEVDKLAEDMFAFRLGWVDLLSFTIPDFKHIETRKAGFDYSERAIDLGNCVMVDGDYVYIYGTENLPGFSKIHVARVPYAARTLYNNWEYSAGDIWVKDIHKSLPIEIDISVSEQFSIFKHNEKYILLTQERGGTEIYTYISDYPNKGFTKKTKVYHIPDEDMDTTNNLFVYNALAHPQYIHNNELLVSYCINSYNVADVFTNVDNYRARFIRIPMQFILEGNKK